MNFFPEPPTPDEDAGEEVDDYTEPEWLAPPLDVLPGVVPVELVIGRSDSTVVALTGMRAFPTGLAMNLNVLVRGRLSQRDLHGEIFDHADPHRRGQTGRLRWGFELSDSRRATNVDPYQDLFPDGPEEGWKPSRPVLWGGGGGSSNNRSAERGHWLWPLPPPGRLRIVFEWTDQGIEQTVTELEADPFIEAAARAVPLWP